ncbi:hypothetical protein EDB89DRAFT_1912565 [Lactarius sanguifluus]|nr:hypothetical protein EDB89DRAFT_1912565 [Lactarius sanguifluus]
MSWHRPLGWGSIVWGGVVSWCGLRVATGPSRGIMVSWKSSPAAGVRLDGETRGTEAGRLPHPWTGSCHLRRLWGLSTGGGLEEGLLREEVGASREAVQMMSPPRSPCRQRTLHHPTFLLAHPTMQPLKRKRDESPTTPQKLMKIQLTVGRRLTCVVPGPLVIPATPSPPPPPSPEDQVLWEDNGERANLCGPGQSVVIRICATSPLGKRQYVEQPSAVLAEKAMAHLGHQLTIEMSHMLTSTIFLFVQSDARTDDNNPPKMFAIFMFVQCQKLQKSSSADSVQENTS